MTENQKHIDLLGLKVIDKVTGFKGVVSSVSFDLYGCIQAVVQPRVDEKGDHIDGRWFDVNRLRVTGKKPVIAVPDFVSGPVAKGEKGPAEKPIL